MFLSSAPDSAVLVAKPDLRLWPAYFSESKPAKFAYFFIINATLLSDISNTFPELMLDWVIQSLKLLTGQKSFVLNGDFANKIICTARFSGNDFDQNGFGLYEIDKTHCDIRSYNTIDGYRAAELKFYEIPAKELCKNSDAYNALLETLYAGAFALSAESIGAMEVCFNMTLEYLKNREQFGKPIGSFQALQHRMVEIMIEIEQAKSAVMLAAGTYEADKNTKYKNISAAKNLVGRTGKLVAEECIQLHGGIAMTWEYKLQNYAKRLVMIDHLMGDSDHHLEQFKKYSDY